MLMNEALPSHLRDLYEAEVRRYEVDDTACDGEIFTDGQVTAVIGGRRGAVSAPAILELSRDDFEALIRRLIAYFRGRRVPFEWKWRSYDLPSFIPEVLIDCGFVGGDEETIMMGDVHELAISSPTLPAGIEIVECSSDGEFEEIAELQSMVWGSDCRWMVDELKAQRDRSQGVNAVYGAKVQGHLVGIGRLETHHDSVVGGLWSGSVLEPWRGHGIYRNLLATRVARAKLLGVTHLVVDASADSQPILQRCGFVKLATTIPYEWSPEDPLNSLML